MLSSLPAVFPKKRCDLYQLIIKRDEDCGGNANGGPPRAEASARGPYERAFNAIHNQSPPTVVSLLTVGGDDLI